MGSFISINSRDKSFFYNCFNCHTNKINNIYLLVSLVVCHLCFKNVIEFTKKNAGRLRGRVLEHGLGKLRVNDGGKQWSPRSIQCGTWHEESSEVAPKCLCRFLALHLCRCLDSLLPPFSPGAVCLVLQPTCHTGWERGQASDLQVIPGDIIICDLLQVFERGSKRVSHGHHSQGKVPSLVCESCFQILTCNLEVGD